ncbi:MAG: hypothetical protein MRECE_1c087 [Mycoplasmataceae bacterium CE_OT135]|nr:MAG: hypothetical protein MRECE_1c087 [Mycoplasmataceae bacterium CE_OT135]
MLENADWEPKKLRETIVEKINMFQEEDLTKYFKNKLNLTFF